MVAPVRRSAASCAEICVARYSPVLNSVLTLAPNTGTDGAGAAGAPSGTAGVAGAPSGTPAPAVAGGRELVLSARLGDRACPPPHPVAPSDTAPASTAAHT